MGHDALSKQHCVLFVAKAGRRYAADLSPRGTQSTVSPVPHEALYTKRNDTSLLVPESVMLLSVVPVCSRGKFLPLDCIV